MTLSEKYDTIPHPVKRAAGFKEFFTLLTPEQQELIQYVVEANPSLEEHLKGIDSSLQVLRDDLEHIMDSVCKLTKGNNR